METTPVTTDAAPVEANLPASTAGMTSVQKQLYKIIVDGQEAEVDIDTLKNGYASNSASQKRFKEASDKNKEATYVLQMLKENPRELLTQMGMNPREIAEAMLGMELEELTMDPKDKELRDLRAKLDKHQKEEAKSKEDFDREQEETATNARLQSITDEMAEVLNEHGFEPSPYSAERFRYWMQTALNAGHIVTPKQVVPYVIKDIQAEVRAMIGSNRDISKLNAILGEDLVRKVAQASVANAKMKEKPVDKSVNEKRVVKEKQKVLSPKDFFGRKNK